MSGGDRRPWLILSQREARAIWARLSVYERENSDLGRAVRQIKLQLAWLNGGGIEEPSIAGAIEREYERH